MNPLDLIPDKFRLLTLVIAIFASFACGTTIGWTANGWRLNAEWKRQDAERQADEKAAVLKRTQENEVEREKNRENNRLLQKSYESEIARLHAAIAAAPRLRVGPAFCGGTPGQAETGSASGGNGADPGSRVLPEEVDRAVKSLIEETEKTAATGRACQKFVNDNGMAP
ncbi:hypothetical protein [Noviherbaspirillum sp.]|uniref:hypothetical protein n=1 Tax=Noviherbaspirillum sp. TaxID=1926288 RepID=UPI002B47A485|nr:hypothetical protein [Noviherbaspirillum sp.]HJV82291.1 hypothetical protein [Noviherbaspirillum sp.]